jgi:TDG/mug DNA glycosylase family protein
VPTPLTSPPRRPTPAELAAAAELTIPDVTGPGLRVLFSGINPGLYSAATGHHFARPGNRFWPTLHKSGFTDRQLRPDEQYLLPGLLLGITNIVARASARADELTAAELRTGGQHLAELAGRLQPRWLAVLGVTAYRAAGRHECLGAAEPERAERTLDPAPAGGSVPGAPGHRGSVTGENWRS